MGWPYVSIPVILDLVMYRYKKPIMGILDNTAIQFKKNGRVVDVFAKYTINNLVGTHPNKKNNRRLLICSIVCVYILLNT